MAANVVENKVTVSVECLKIALCDVFTISLITGRTVYTKKYSRSSRIDLQSGLAQGQKL